VKIVREEKRTTYHYSEHCKFLKMDEEDIFAVPKFQNMTLQGTTKRLAYIYVKHGERTQVPHPKSNRKPA
jgi:hypothetical protein